MNHTKETVFCMAFTFSRGCNPTDSYQQLSTALSLHTAQEWQTSAQTGSDT